ncbi:MAG: hypothetical protein HC804_12815 [Anaerolineae bacterium]|nr:hypothetical protein [Anaerolineae bacterium]
MRANGDNKLHKVQMALTLLLMILGALLILLALGIDRLGLNLTPGFGIAQMFQLLVGLSCLTLAAFLYARSLHPQQTPRSLQADIGIRLAATGLVFAYIVGLADLIGIGTHVNPRFERPFVGPFQFGGLLLALGMIVIGLILYHTSRGAGRDKSSMEFLVNGDGQHGEQK